MTFNEFAESDPRLTRNAWVYEPGLMLYVRRPFARLHNADFELANLSADVPGRGALTAFVDRYGTKFTFFIENIVEYRLMVFFQSHGFRLIDDISQAPDICMISSACRHYRDGR